MRVTITQSLYLTPEQKQLMLLHGPLNLLSVIQGSLSLLAMAHGDSSDIIRSMDEAKEYIQKIRSFTGDMRSLSASYFSSLRSFVASFSDGTDGTIRRAKLEQDQHYLDMLTMAVGRLEIATTRLGQYLLPEGQQVPCQHYSIDEVISSVRGFLTDVADHSCGRYSMNFTGQSLASNDYFVPIQVVGRDGMVSMPEIFWDVIYDLLANARKYTKPGGTLGFDLNSSANVTTIKVADSGRGIPCEEISKVVEFGYRASNARDGLSSIGGFGLTKVYYLCQSYGGTMAISSELGKGTEFVIQIPIPE